MPLVTGKIGLEDLALGEGTQVQDLGRGRTRTITKINAGNLPFDNASSLKEAITAFKLVLQSAEVLNITSNKEAIIALSNDISKFHTIYNSMDSLKLLSDKSELLNDLQSNITDIKILHDTISKTKQEVTDTKYRELKITNTQKALNKKLGYITNICSQDILPMKSQLDMLLGILNTKIDTIKADLVTGNEMAHKLATYTWDLQLVRACKVPKWYIDDLRRKIVLIIPQPICANILPEPNSQYVQDSVDTYLKTLPNLGGIDEPITVDDLEPILEVCVNHLDWGHEITDAEARVRFYIVDTNGQPMLNITNTPIQAYKLDAADTIVGRWTSTLANGTVGKTLDVLQEGNKWDIDFSEIDANVGKLLVTCSTISSFTVGADVTLGRVRITKEEYDTYAALEPVDGLRFHRVWLEYHPA